ncbi:MAG TPA: RNA-binding protein [Chitinophagaceae bacterium]|jgi:RNA recognition motif-containing protein
MKIYIENLHDVVDNEKLSQVFSAYGEVKSAQVVMDAFTGASRGFGYVEMEDEAAQKAITALDQTSLNDLKITVKEAPQVVTPKGSYKVGNGAVNVYRFNKN